MERLQKVMAHAGVASRRKCEEYILAGRVSVNGQVVKELGAKVAPSDKIEVDGVPLYKEEPVYYLFNKPAGVISAASDDKNRRVVTDYFADVPQRIYPVGRLDYDTTGLLLLTNDGEFSQLLTHPKYHVDKTYHARVNGIPDDKQLKALRYGVVIEGRKTSRARVNVLQTDAKKQTALVELTIHEGWNHQVKNMFKAVGLTVTKLTRVRFGSLDLDFLPVGAYRPLKGNEVNRLKLEAQQGRQGGQKAVGKKAAGKAKPKKG